MKKRMIQRVLCALLALALLLALASCSGNTLHASPRANKAVAKAGNVTITYDELYYLAKNKQAELLLDTTLDAATRRAELERFVWDNLLTSSHALISVARDYGIKCDKGDIAENVQLQLEDLIANAATFAGDYEAYAASLDEAYMTEHYLRTYLAVENYLATAVILEMIERGELDDSDETALAAINGSDYIRTVHVYIAKNNGVNTEALNHLNAQNIANRLAAITEDAARYEEMRNAIKNYDNEKKDTTGDGFYFARGEMDERYEEAAFSLPVYGASGVVEVENGYYVIMRMPIEETYVNRNLDTLKGNMHFVKLNAMVNARYAELQNDFERTRFGDKLDLENLPQITANGGATLRTLLIVVGVCVGVGGVITACALLLRRKPKKSAKRTR